MKVAGEPAAAPAGGRSKFFRGVTSHQWPPRVSLSFAGFTEYHLKALTGYLNGERICTASLGHAGHVSADASLIGDGDESGFLQVGGFDGTINQHVKWCFQQLKVGDEVRILVEEAQEIDEPNERKSVEEMDRWARSLRPRKKPKQGDADELHPLPAPWE